MGRAGRQILQFSGIVLQIEELEPVMTSLPGWVGAEQKRAPTRPESA